MRLWKGSASKTMWIMVVVLVAVLALPTVAAASAHDLKSTSTVAYFSVVRDEEPFAGFTETDLKSTSLIPYYSVLH